MNQAVRELRLAWALLLAVAAGGLLPSVTEPVVAGIWLTAALAGSLVVLRERGASRAASAISELLQSRRSRIQGTVILALLTIAALVFSPSAALFLATTLGAGLLWAAARGRDRAVERVVDHLSALGGALVLVLLPLELVLRTPWINRQFGLPQERIRQEQSYDRLWERNVLRLRSPYEQVRRRPGVKRVLALGDSFTWGLYIADSDSTWPAQLERRLAGPVEVINMGQRGWTTFNQAEFLTRMGWQFQPDLVIVQFYLNDIYESRPNLAHEEGRRLYLLPTEFWQGYIRTSALSALVSKGVNGLVLGTLLRDSEYAVRYARESAGWRQMRAALRQMADSARSRGIPIILVLYPDLTAGEWTPETYPARSIHEQVAREASAAGFAVLDLTGAFSSRGGDWKRWWATPYDSHPGEEAHAVAAQAIAAYVEAHSLLKQAPPLLSGRMDP